MLATRWTLRVSTHTQNAELRFKCVERQEPADERVSLLEDQLDCFRCLKNANYAREHAQDTSCVSGRRQISGRWFWEETAVTWSFPRLVHSDLSLKPEDTSVNDRFAGNDARIVE
jgi:hypothetical protein